MLLWALFTLGFFAGVFITLYVTSSMEEIATDGIKRAVNTEHGSKSDHWRIYSELVKINTKNERLKKHGFTPESVDLATSIR